MGGVDLLDRFISDFRPRLLKNKLSFLQKIFPKFRKLQVVNWLVDSCLHQFWILFCALELL